MPKKQYQLVIGFIVLGVFFLGLFFYYQGYSDRSNEIGLQLATVTKENGKAFLLRNGLSQKDEIKTKMPLGNLDSVETNDIGSAHLKFESGFQVRLKPASLITLERIDEVDGFHAALIIKRGDIAIVSDGRESQLIIGKNGERINAEKYNESELAKKSIAPLKPLEDFSTKVENTSLTEEEITAVLQQHRSSFFKCYAKLLQTHPKLKGDVTLNFTIEASGRLSATEISSSQISDSEFKNCLIDVLKRITFRQFSGVPISTVFPIHFE